MPHIFFNDANISISNPNKYWQHNNIYSNIIFTFSEEYLSGYLHVLNLLINFINQLVSCWISSKFNFC